MRNREYVSLNVLITPEQKAILEEIARELQVSVSALVRRLLTETKSGTQLKKHILQGGKR